jgi:hypothetical protein
MTAVINRVTPDVFIVFLISNKRAERTTDSQEQPVKKQAKKPHPNAALIKI